MKTYGLIIVIVGSMAMLAGCSNTWTGLKQTGRGVVQDVKSWGTEEGPVKKADNWMREHLW